MLAAVTVARYHWSSAENWASTRSPAFMPAGCERPSLTRQLGQALERSLGRTAGLGVPIACRETQKAANGSNQSVS